MAESVEERKSDRGQSSSGGVGYRGRFLVGEGLVGEGDKDIPGVAAAPFRRVGEKVGWGRRFRLRKSLHANERLHSPRHASLRQPSAGGRFRELAISSSESW